MKRSIPFFLIVFATLLFATDTVAQSDQKQDEAKKKAMEVRYHHDKAAAEYVRYKFNMTSWIGAKYADLEASWGKPTRIENMGALGGVVIYERVSYTSSGSFKPGYFIDHITTQKIGGTVISQYVNTEEVKPVDTRKETRFMETVRIHKNEEGIIIAVDYDTDLKRRDYGINYFEY